MKVVVHVVGLVLGAALASNSEAQAATVTPSPEMARLIKLMSGAWSTTLTYEPNASLPNGGRGHGKQVWRAGPGGLSLIEDETAVTPTGRWDGMSVTWWDPTAKGFRAIWCDNHQASCIVMKDLAHWEGDEFVLGDEWQRDGKSFRYKEVQSDITARSFVLTSYNGAVSEPLKKTLTVRATRIGGER